MPNRLEPYNLVDFSGGLNLRENQFQLETNESPKMENITIDPLGGVYSRRGWERWNPDDVVDPTVVTWDPRRAFMHALSDGTENLYIASDHKLYSADGDTSFSLISGVPTGATPHMADFVAWGDYLFIACGRGNQVRRRRLSEAPTTLNAAESGHWNNDYTSPLGAMAAPKCELMEAHSGYLFAANTVENSATFPNRLRWSHPTSPTDWAENDFIDIDVGGNRITGLMSFEDHLLIFKPDGIWALYGYNLDSWQLVQKSSTIGVLSPQAITRSERAIFFASQSDRGGVYVYDGERPIEVSEQLRYVFEHLGIPEMVWVGWLDRKLWVTLPWTYEGPQSDSAAAFVFDPTVGQRGAWTYYRSQLGALGPLVGGSNVDTELHPLGVLRGTEHPCVVRLNAREEASDVISDIGVLGFTGIGTEGYIVTGSDSTTGAEIVMSGMPGTAAFRTIFKTGWINAEWPTRKKSFRRPDIVCRDTGVNHRFQVTSYRDYEESFAKRQYHVDIPAGAAGAVWGEFIWGDGTIYGEGNKKGALIRRGSSFGLCKALQLQIEGVTPGAAWGIDAIILKIVMRRFR